MFRQSSHYLTLFKLCSFTGILSNIWKALIGKKHFYFRKGTFELIGKHKMASVADLLSSEKTMLMAPKQCTSIRIRFNPPVPTRNVLNYFFKLCLIHEWSKVKYSLFLITKVAYGKEFSPLTNHMLLNTLKQTDTVESNSTL